MKKHQKHTQLKRRESENFANNEIAILGSKCSIISDFVQKIGKKLQKRAKISYFDASHADEISTPSVDSFTFHHSGSLTSNTTSEINKYNEQIRLSQYDLLVINGNHFKGQNKY